MGLVKQRSAGARSTTSRAGYIIALLALGNVLSFFDRQLPAALLGQIQATFGITDTAAAALISVFVLAAAGAALPLGALADRWPRHTVAGLVLIVWSLFTALGGVVGGIIPVEAVGTATAFGILLVSRVGVGIGEAGFLPSAGGLITDLYPPDRRSRPNALVMLGLPLGILLAFLLAGVLAHALGSWQAVFLVAAPPGLILGVLLLLVREPARGARDVALSAESATAVKGGVRTVLRVQSFRRLVVAYMSYNFGSYALATFITLTLQRSFGLAQIPAGALSAVVLGVGGLVGLLLGGWFLDRADPQLERRRVRLTAALLITGATTCGVGLFSSELVVFVCLLSVGYLLGSVYVAASIPMIADVIQPRHRSTAIGVMTSIGLLLGGAGGPVAAGVLSDTLGSPQIALQIIVPAAYGLAGLALLRTGRSFPADLIRVRARPVATGAGSLSPS